MAVLVEQFQRLHGVTASRKSYGFIGKLAKKYGEEAVRRAIRDAGEKIGRAAEPLEYLAGVVQGNGHRLPVSADIDPRQRFLQAASGARS